MPVTIAVVVTVFVTNCDVVRLASAALPEGEDEGKTWVERAALDVLMIEPPLGSKIAAAPSRSGATVATTWSVPFVAVLVGLGPTLYVCVPIVAMKEHVAVASLYCSPGCSVPT